MDKPNNVIKIDVVYVARLARLVLSNEEVERLGKQLNDILEYVSKLNELNTQTDLPLSHVLPMENIYREDEARPSLSIDEVLKNAPSKENSFFKVPKVIE